MKTNNFSNIHTEGFKQQRFDLSLGQVTPRRKHAAAY